LYFQTVCTITKISILYRVVNIPNLIGAAGQGERATIIINVIMSMLRLNLP